MPKRRKLRSDRNFLVYLIQSECGETYIGKTVMDGPAIVKSMKRRLDGHDYGAHKDRKNTTVASWIRKHGIESFTMYYIEKVRGNLAISARESELINTLHPTLNDKRQAALAHLAGTVDILTTVGITDDTYKTRIRASRWRQEAKAIAATPATPYSALHRLLRRCCSFNPTS